MKIKQCDCIWDKKEKTFLGRKGRPWAEICAFFWIFYAILLSYFCGMLSFFFQTVSDHEPSLIGDDSFLKTPGLGIRPLLRTDDDRAFTSMIYFTNDAYNKRTKACIDNVKEALKPYKVAYSENYALYWKHCSVSSGPNVQQSCIMRYTDLTDGNCDEDHNFGYPEGKPCVFIRLNKIYGWKPEPYTKADDSMPDELKSAVTAYYSDPQNANKHLVWLHCQGEDDFDKDLLGNTTGYFHQQGFLESSFPFLNQYRHLAPAIMVKFNGLRPNVAVKVHCKTYAKNIHFDLATWTGAFHLELFYETE